MYRALDRDHSGGTGAQARPLHVASPQDAPLTGRLDLGFARRGASTCLSRSFQAGGLRVRLPRRETDAESPCAVLINTAGGVVGGDRLEQSVAWGADTRATATTQAAEKVYRTLAGSGPARIDTRIEVAEGAHAEWLPQETILLDRCDLHRETRVLLAENVTFLGVEALILGRAAMGEQLRGGRLRDCLRIWRGGRLVYADALRLEGDIAALMDRAAIGEGARAMAVIVHAGADAGLLLEPLRGALARARGTVAASHWNGLLAVRLLAPDGQTLRHDIALALYCLRAGRPLPRVWRC